MTEFLIVYTRNGIADIGDLVTLAADYWEACEIGWSKIPEGADDFQVYEGGVTGDPHKPLWVSVESDQPAA